MKEIQWWDASNVMHVERASRDEFPKTLNRIGRSGGTIRKVNSIPKVG